MHLNIVPEFAYLLLLLQPAHYNITAHFHLPFNRPSSSNPTVLHSHKPGNDKYVYPDRIKGLKYMPSGELL